MSYFDSNMIACICGSMKFYYKMLHLASELTKQGYIVLMPFVRVGGDPQVNHFEDKKLKEMLDDLHKHKIDMSWRVYIVTVNGYMGESTRSEYLYALNQGKTVIIVDYNS